MFYVSRLLTASFHSLESSGHLGLMMTTVALTGGIVAIVVVDARPGRAPYPCRRRRRPRWQRSERSCGCGEALHGVSLRVNDKVVHENLQEGPTGFNTGN